MTLIGIFLSFVAAACLVVANLVLHGDKVHGFWVLFIAGDACAVAGCVVAGSGLLSASGRSRVGALVGVVPNLIVLAASISDLVLLYGVGSPG